MFYWIALVGSAMVASGFLTMFAVCQFFVHSLPVTDEQKEEWARRVPFLLGIVVIVLLLEVIVATSCVVLMTMSMLDIPPGL